MTTTTSTTGSTSGLSQDFINSVNPKNNDASLMQATENRFLKLLTAQLKNQDPMNPLDNAQMTSQMAQISTVNGIEKLNATLEKMMSSSTEAQAMQAAAMLGHNVLVAGDGITVGESGQAFGGIQFPQSVDSAAITIKDSNGLVIRTINLGAQEAGQQTFSWDGKNDAGEAVAAGRYTFSVAAAQGGKSVTTTGLELAQVTGILRDKSGILLELGQLGKFELSDIQQIY